MARKKSRSRCAHGRKKTDRHGCKKKPGPKRGSRRSRSNNKSLNTDLKFIKDVIKKACEIANKVTNKKWVAYIDQLNNQLAIKPEEECNTFKNKLAAERLKCKNMNGKLVKCANGRNYQCLVPQKGTKVTISTSTCKPRPAVTRLLGSSVSAASPKAVSPTMGGRGAPNVFAPPGTTGGSTNAGSIDDDDVVM